MCVCKTKLIAEAKIPGKFVYCFQFLPTFVLSKPAFPPPLKPVLYRLSVYYSTDTYNERFSILCQISSETWKNVYCLTPCHLINHTFFFSFLSFLNHDKNISCEIKPIDNFFKCTIQHC